MTITAVVGIPGAGKTLYTVSEIAREYQNRKIYYYGIPELTLDWQKLDDPTEWINLPNDVVIIVDEAHEAFPSRDYRKPPPPHVEAMATHRHRGIDIVLITQYPKDLDKFIRERVGRFIVIETPLLGGATAKVYQWPKFEEYYNIPAVREKAEHFLWNHPKESYGTYKSAVTHTKPKKPLRALKKAIGYALIGVGAVSFGAYKLVSSKAVEKTPEKTITVAQVAPVKSSSAQPWIESHTPRVLGIPASAPVFDEVRKVETYPRLNCIASAKKCQCYTQQSTRSHVPEAVCRDIVENGFFDYSQPERG